MHLFLKHQQYSNSGRQTPERLTIRNSTINSTAANDIFSVHFFLKWLESLCQWHQNYYGPTASMMFNMFLLLQIFRFVGITHQAWYWNTNLLFASCRPVSINISVYLHQLYLSWNLPRKLYWMGLGVYIWIFITWRMIDINIRWWISVG